MKFGTVIEGTVIETTDTAFETLAQAEARVEELKAQGIVAQVVELGELTDANGHPIDK